MVWLEFVVRKMMKNGMGPCSHHAICHVIGHSNHITLISACSRNGFWAWGRSHKWSAKVLIRLINHEAERNFTDCGRHLGDTLVSFTIKKSSSRPPCSSLDNTRNADFVIAGMWWWALPEACSLSFHNCTICNTGLQSGYHYILDHKNANMTTINHTWWSSGSGNPVLSSCMMWVKLVRHLKQQDLTFPVYGKWKGWSSIMTSSVSLL